MQNMQTSYQGKLELCGHEGISLRKYKDSVGVWTIGIGFTKTEIPDLASWPRDKTITMKQCFEIFDVALKRYENAINKNLKRPILQTQFDALVSWCYNVGVGWVAKSTVMARLNANAAPQALYDALMMYDQPKEIIGRRRKEAVLLKTGKYSNNGKAQLLETKRMIDVAAYLKETQIIVPTPAPIPAPTPQQPTAATEIIETDETITTKIQNFLTQPVGFVEDIKKFLAGDVI